jgi:DNA-binding MarR family transcriptional regulator
MLSYSSQAARLLLAHAGTQGAVEGSRYALAFHHLEVGERLRASLRTVLALHGLSELQFAILIVLMETKAKAPTMAMLASSSGASRSAVTDALDKLETHGIAHRLADARDRRVTCVQLSQSGYAKASQAASDYLNVLSQDMEHLSAALSHGLRRMPDSCGSFENPTDTRNRAQHGVGALPQASTNH